MAGLRVGEPLGDRADNVVEVGLEEEVAAVDELDARIRRVAADVFKATNRTVARLENDAAPATGGTR